jgi:hypothetical protein
MFDAWGWLVWFAITGFILIVLGSVLARNMCADRTAVALIGSGVIFLGIFALGVFGFGLSAAIGRDVDGRYAGSPLHEWFEHLSSGKGPCCSDADGTALSDVDWESKDGHYRVRIDNRWWDVPDEAVIKEPNRAGRTMVWPVYYNGYAAALHGHVEIRCFMPGSMTFLKQRRPVITASVGLLFALSPKAEIIVEIAMLIAAWAFVAFLTFFFCVRRWR